MLEKALTGSKRYYGWVTALLAVIGLGFAIYLWQLSFGLGITGMSRDVTWGFYIAQFTFLVGVAASAVMVILPYYLHNYKAFGKITVLGEFLAVASIVMCALFIFVDLGQPARVLNILLYPSPNSILFWVHDCIKRIPYPEYYHRLESARSRTKQGGPTGLVKTVDIYFYPLGDQHSYCYRISLQRSSGKRILVNCYSGTAISCVSFCIRSCVFNPAVPDCSETNKV